MEAKERSKVVGVRLSSKEHLLLQLYAKAKNISVVELVQTIMENFLHFPHKLVEMHEADFIRLLIEEANKKADIAQGREGREGPLDSEGGPHNAETAQDISMKPLTFRVGEFTLQEWDRIAEGRFITRTTLIRQAINAFFDPDLQLDLKLQDEVVIQFKQILNKVIQRLEKVEYNEIMDIFDGVSPKILNDLLGALEQEGRIGRKGFDTYVPATPIEFE